ncbi:hypothetical protein NitYY0814_C0436 [Nitratiruptor sp. YY08-14]|nr:hypothetical protein NitYY0810_C0436 [Nitratiruptor sp. YY08-10]BCD63608.1 hypothetical protein NitYY0814_C0436 [Nitratiruptor sp. YY08-14]
MLPKEPSVFPIPQAVSYEAFLIVMVSKNGKILEIPYMC